MNKKTVTGKMRRAIEKRISLLECYLENASRDLEQLKRLLVTDSIEDLPALPGDARYPIVVTAGINSVSGLLAYSPSELLKACKRKKAVKGVVYALEELGLRLRD